MWMPGSWTPWKWLESATRIWSRRHQTFWCLILGRSMGTFWFRFCLVVLCFSEHLYTFLIISWTFDDSMNSLRTVLSASLCLVWSSHCVPGNSLDAGGPCRCGELLVLQNKFLCIWLVHVNIFLNPLPKSLRLRPRSVKPKKQPPFPSQIQTSTKIWEIKI